MWEMIKKWLADLGEFLFKFTKTAAAQFIKQYGPIAKDIVMRVAAAPGLNGKERFELACSMFLVEVPGAATYLVNTCIQVAYAMYKEEMEKIDTDGDKIPDYRDLCKEAGLEVTGCVDENGCPIPCP